MATETLSDRDRMLERFVVLEAHNYMALGACGMLLDVEPFFGHELIPRANPETHGAGSWGFDEWQKLWPASDEGVGRDEEAIAEARAYMLAAEMLQAFADDPDGCRNLARQLLARARDSLTFTERTLGQRAETASAVSETIARLAPR